MTRRLMAAAVAAAAVLGACGAEEAGEAVPAREAAPAAPAPPPPPELSLEVDVAARRLTVRQGGQVAGTFPVGVGRPDWPTQNGEWTVTQVVWNPGWTPPPDEEWTKDEEPKDPGDPDNPLGTVQIVYDPPRTIHGTNQPESVGSASSHGSIRMRNEDAERVARMVMEAGGASRDETFFAEVRANRTRRVEVPIPNPVAIRVVNGAENADAVEGEADSGDREGARSGSSPASSDRQRREAASSPGDSAPPPGDSAHHDH